MRVLIAARLSRKVQGQRGAMTGQSIEDQDRITREWAADHEHTVVDIAADTKSGTVAPQDRKKLKPWVTDPAKIALYDAILASDVDRLSRGAQEDFTRIEAWALDNGKLLLIGGDEFPDGLQYPGRDHAEWERWHAECRRARREFEKIRSRSMRRQAQLDRDGYLVGKAPFGMVVAGDKYSKSLTADPAHRETIRELYEMIANGTGTEVAADWLSAHSDRTWWPRQIPGLIRRPVYKGVRTSNDGQRVYNVHVEAIVDDDLWQRANDNLAGRLVHRGPRKLKRPKALLTSVLKCARCASRGADSPMYRTTSARGNLSYVCHGRGPQAQGCGVALNLETCDQLAGDLMAGLEAEITEVVTAQFDYDGAVRELRNQAAALDIMADGYAELVAELQRQIRELQAHQRESGPRRAGTGQTYADKWRSLDVTRRGDWLRQAGMVAYAGRDVQEVAQALALAMPPAWTGRERIAGDFAEVHSLGDVTMALIFDPSALMGLEPGE